MRSVRGMFASTRARLTLWNTITFAIVLVSLGIVFRILAERSLLTALDREMHVQAGRFREMQRIDLVVLQDKTPHSVRTMRFVTRSSSTVHVTDAHMNAQVRFVEDTRSPAPDRSGQFLYRTFDLKGAPFPPAAPDNPFETPRSSPIDRSDIQEKTADRRPWDAAGFAAAARGKEQYALVTSGGTPMRVLSLPLMHGDSIGGVVQIATTLGQLHRDIAGLTGTLLLALPIALIVAMAAGIFLTDRALRPVQEMTRAAEAIRPEQLSRRLPVRSADEFGKLAATFNNALDRVQTAFSDRERAISQLRRFTADASHELRTPLTSIKANTGVALAETAPSNEHIHALRQIDRAADRMTSLVQDLLLLARSDSGQLTLEMTPVSLADVVRDAVESLPGAQHAPIDCTAMPQDAIVNGDYDHLRRLFLNLLLNAAKHTPLDGQIGVTIETADSPLRTAPFPLSGGAATDMGAGRAESLHPLAGGEAEASRSRAIVRIRDTGCGIAPEHLPNIGQPFFRVDTSRTRKMGGAGLGIAICRSIAAAHRAELQIASEPSNGTCVTISFALARPAVGRS